MLSWWLTAALDPDFRQIQYFFLSNTEEFTPHRPSRSVAIILIRKNTDFNENRGPRRQSATRDNMKSSYSCSVMMMMNCEKTTARKLGKRKENPGKQKQNEMRVAKKRRLARSATGTRVLRRLMFVLVCPGS